MLYKLAAAWEVKNWRKTRSLRISTIWALVSSYLTSYVTRMHQLILLSLKFINSDLSLIFYFKYQISNKWPISRPGHIKLSFCTSWFRGNYYDPILDICRVKGPSETKHMHTQVSPICLHVSICICVYLELNNSNPDLHSLKGPTSWYSLPERVWIESICENRGGKIYTKYL